MTLKTAKLQAEVFELRYLLLSLWNYCSLILTALEIRAFSLYSYTEVVISEAEVARCPVRVTEMVITFIEAAEDEGHLDHLGNGLSKNGTICTEENGSMV